MTPRTAAGRALYQSLQARQSQSVEPISTLPSKGWPFLDAILAIEAEAASSAVVELRAAVEALPGYRDPRYSGQFETKEIIYRAAVLRLIDEAGPSSDNYGDLVKDDDRKALWDAANAEPSDAPEKETRNG